MKRLELTIEGVRGTRSEAFEITDLVIAGWAGRDQAAQEHHIAELEALGIARPAQTPTYYRVATERLTTGPVLEVSGPYSSGEVEPLLLSDGERLYIGVGSDHTDREVEKYGITVSKQMCGKPMADRLWLFDDVCDHWDRLILRSHATVEGKRQLYQEGSIANLLHPLDVISRYGQGKSLAGGTAMFGGTVGAIGGIRPASHFEGEIEDPVLGRRLDFGYEVKILPIAG